MTRLLQYAFEKASALPNGLQDDLAQQWLEELEWELQWDETLERSQDLLENMALKALQEYQSGKTMEMGFDLPLLTSDGVAVIAGAGLYPSTHARRHPLHSEATRMLCRQDS